MMLCSKCTHESYCDMAQFGQQEPPITACYCFKAKRQTNGDKYFHNTTDEKLSQFLSDIGACFWDDADVCEKWNGACDKCWLGWLKQEVEE